MLFRVVCVALIFTTTLVVANESENGTNSDLQRIFGSGISNPPITSYPWVVAVFRNMDPPPTGTGTLVIYGVGVAVNRYWVLSSGMVANYARTSADADEILVKFGSSDISATCTACQIRRVVKGIQHPDYVPVSFLSNIGVIKVCPYFPTTMTYAPLPVTPPTISAGMSGISLGWQSGQTALRAMTQVVGDATLCSTVAAGVPYEALNFCTSVANRGTCNADRGGPFVMNNEVVAVLDASACPDTTKTDTYTKLDSLYLTWISSNTPSA